MSPVTVQRGLRMADYLAMGGVSASLLHVLATTTPAHARVYETQPREDTSALIVGEAVHYAALEPDAFATRYACPPKVDKRTNAGKAEWAAWVADHPDCVPLTHDEYEIALGTANSLRNNAEIARYLYGPGLNEVTLSWTGEGGVKCKARPDRIVEVDGWTFVPDIKTGRSASPYGFSKAIAEYGYHQKAAWYLDALNMIDQRERRFVFIAVEKEEPFAAAMYELTDEAIGQGREDNARAYETYLECVRTGRWPGYPTGIQYIDLPKWKQRVNV